MKNNIEFYPHYTNSHEHWKFELLRAKYDWAGEGKFWALNNMIGLSDNTVLDLSNPGKKATIANKLKFTNEEFDEYLTYLADKCELIIYRDGEVTTDVVLNCLQKVSAKRDKARERIKSYREKEQSNADVTQNKKNVTGNKRKERRVKDSTANESTVQDILDASSEAPKSLYKKFISVYDDFIKEKTSCPAKIDGTQGKAAKEIIGYFRGASKDNSDEGILNSWRHFLGSWNKLDTYNQGKLKLSEINSDMVNIVNQIKNGTRKTGKHETVSVGAVHSYIDKVFEDRKNT
jgi:hypothetical protein